MAGSDLREASAAAASPAARAGAGEEAWSAAVVGMASAGHLRREWRAYASTPRSSAELLGGQHKGAEGRPDLSPAEQFDNMKHLTLKSIETMQVHAKQNTKYFSGC
jgi:hypothetical protein